MNEDQNVGKQISLDDTKFITTIKSLIAENLYNNAVDANRIVLVWFCKTIQNAKAMLYPLGTSDYFEVTLNGDRSEVYIDQYTKMRKWTVPIESDKPLITTTQD